MESGAGGAEQEQPERSGWWARLERAVGLLATAATLAVAAFTWVSISQVSDEQRITREGQITDRYNDAIKNLGDGSVDVRFGGIYALQRIMRDSTRDQPSVVSVLSAYVRVHAAASGKSESAGKPSNDVVAALTVLSQRNSRHDGSSQVDLEGSHLGDVRMNSADLGEADLGRTDLSGARLQHARLAEADLHEADLRGADLGANAAVSGSLPRGSAVRSMWSRGADLRSADLSEADLRGADLSGAYLQNAELRGARLRGTSLAGTDLSNADLSHQDLRDADLSATDLQGADLSGADVRGTDLRYAQIGSGQLLSVSALDRDTRLSPSLAKNPEVRAAVKLGHPGDAGP